MSLELAERVTHLPQAFEAGEKSTASLLKDAGFPDRLGELHVEEVEQVLEQEPSLTQLWLARGRDQRASNGWGIEQTGEGYRVVCFSDGYASRPKDPIPACAEFVVRYVGTIADVLTREG